MQQLLDKLGWSQAFFANRAGVDVMTVNRWCNGKGRPGLAMLYLKLVLRQIGDD